MGEVSPETDRLGSIYFERYVRSFLCRLIGSVKDDISSTQQMLYVMKGNRWLSQNAK